MNKKKQVLTEMDELARICGLTLKTLYQYHYDGRFDIESLESVIRFAHPLILERDAKELQEFRDEKKKQQEKRAKGEIDF